MCRQNTHYSNLSYIKWRITSFHWMKAQAKPPKKSHLIGKKVFSNRADSIFYSILFRFLHCSSTVPVTMYASTFLSKTSTVLLAPKLKCSLSIFMAMDCTLSKCWGVRIWNMGTCKQQNLFQGEKDARFCFAMCFYLPGSLRWWGKHHLVADPVKKLLCLVTLRIALLKKT